MGILQRVRQPKTTKGKNFLLAREPQVYEKAKRTLFIRGGKTNQIVVDCMKDLCKLRKPLGTFLNKKNDWHPFEDITPVEQVTKKYDSSTFMFASHSKKRPNHLTLGRMFDQHLLDMFELGIESFKKLQDFKSEKVTLGSKPCLLFCGDNFEFDYDCMRLKSMLIDFFQNELVDYVRLQGLEHVIMFTAANEYIHLRSYRILFKKSGVRIPRVELQEMGPSLDLKLKRVKLASEDLFRKACQQPKELKVTKVKNISKDGLGTTHGRIHIPKQNINKLQTRKMKGLKKTRVTKKGNAGEKGASTTGKKAAPRQPRKRGASTTNDHTRKKRK